MATNSILGGLLGSVKKAASSVTDSTTQLFTASPAAADATLAGGSPAAKSALPSWLVPVALLAAVAFAAVKFLPKVFKKGRGTRSTTRR